MFDILKNSKWCLDSLVVLRQYYQIRVHVYHRMPSFYQHLKTVDMEIHHIEYHVTELVDN